MSATELRCEIHGTIARITIDIGAVLTQPDFADRVAAFMERKR